MESASNFMTVFLLSPFIVDLNFSICMFIYLILLLSFRESEMGGGY